MANKIQPLDRTLVTEFNIFAADINTRVRQLTGSIAAKVSATDNFVSGDANVGPILDITLNPINKFVIIHSYSELLLDLTNASGIITDVPCSGLFVHYGALTSIKIKAAVATRLTYIYS